MNKSTWVIYDRATSAILKIRNRNGRTTEWYLGESAAKAALTRYSKQSGVLPTDPSYPLYQYGLAESEYYHKTIERTVTRKNFMTGEEFEESINTPYYCSPSSETYWSN